MKNKSLTANLAIAIVVIGASATYARDVRCSGSIGAIVVDNVFVPDGASCTLSGTRVRGNIQLGLQA